MAVWESPKAPCNYEGFIMLKISSRHLLDGSVDAASSLVARATHGLALAGRLVALRLISAA